MNLKWNNFPSKHFMWRRVTIGVSGSSRPYRWVNEFGQFGNQWWGSIP